jgi:hypothetical protein
MRKRDELLLIELVDEALKHIPKNGITNLELWNAIPNLRRVRGIDAYCIEKRRSHRSSRTAGWLDLQAREYEKRRKD